MHKHNLISILIPVFSILLFTGAYFFLDPSTTGLVIYEPNQTNKLVNADVILKTKPTEVIPADAIVEVSIDGKKAQMSIAEFIKKTGNDYKIEKGEIPDFNFYGLGFTGDYTYGLTLADFKIDRNIGIGEHTFITRIKYQNRVLYEKENNIMISE